MAGTDANKHFMIHVPPLDLLFITALCIYFPLVATKNDVVVVVVGGLMVAPLHQRLLRTLRNNTHLLSDCWVSVSVGRV